MTDLSPVARVFKDAQAIRLAQIEREKDKFGRSMAWKVKYIQNDLAAKVDNDLTRIFAAEVARIAEKMLKAVE